MKDLICMFILTFILFAIPCGGVYYWMQSSCAERGEMEGYKITKTVAIKCYGSNNGYNWTKIWY